MATSEEEEFFIKNSNEHQSNSSWVGGLKLYGEASSFGDIAL